MPRRLRINLILSPIAIISNSYLFTVEESVTYIFKRSQYILNKKVKLFSDKPLDININV